LRSSATHAIYVNYVTLWDSYVTQKVLQSLKFVTIKTVPRMSVITT